MPGKSWRAWVGKRKEGGFEAGVDVKTQESEHHKIVAVPTEKIIGKKIESPFKGVRNIPEKYEGVANALAMVLLFDLESFSAKGEINVNETDEMRLQGPNVNTAIEVLKEGNVSSKQVAKFAFKTLRVAGQDVEPRLINALIRTAQIRFGEVKVEGSSKKITEAQTFSLKEGK